jgi:hypothetical protein
MAFLTKETLWIIFIVSGMLITGTINTIVKKVQNGWTAPGIIGRDHKVRQESSIPHLLAPITPLAYSDHLV